MLLLAKDDDHQTFSGKEEEEELNSPPVAGEAVARLPVSRSWTVLWSGGHLASRFPAGPGIPVSRSPHPEIQFPTELDSGDKKVLWAPLDKYDESL